MGRDHPKFVKEIVVFIGSTVICAMIALWTGEDDDEEDTYVAPAAEIQIPPNTLCVETRPDGIRSLARCKTGSASAPVPAVPQP